MQHLLAFHSLLGRDRFDVDATLSGEEKRERVGRRVGATLPITFSTGSLSHPTCSSGRWERRERRSQPRKPPNSTTTIRSFLKRSEKRRKLSSRKRTYLATPITNQNILKKYGIAGLGANFDFL